MSVKRFPADTDLPFNKTLFATAATDVVSDLDVAASITTDGIAVELNAGDIAVLADRAGLKVYNGSKWRDVDGGLQGQTTIVTDNVAVPLFTFTVPTTLTAHGGILEYMVFVRSTTVVQIEVGSVAYGALNEAGTVTPVVVAAPTDAAIDAGGGTNVVAISAAAVGTLVTVSAVANTSLTIAAAHVKWRARPIGGTDAAAVYALPAA